MTSDNDLNLIGLQELVNDVGAEQTDVVLLEGVPRQVRMNTQDVIVHRGVRPQQIHGDLLRLIIDLTKLNLQRPLNLLNVLDLL